MSSGAHLDEAGLGKPGWAAAFWAGFNASVVGMALTDGQLRLVAVNEALAGFIGREPQELVGNPAAALVCAEDRDRLQGALERAAGGEVSNAGEEVTLAAPPGVECRALVSASPIPGEGGLAGGLLVHVQDVTARRRTEDELRLSEHRFRLLVESAEDHAIYMLDPQGRVALWNAGAARLKGYSAEEVLGDHVRRFYTPEDQVQGVPERLLAQARAEGSVRAEGWRMRKDGTRFWAEVTITALRGGDGALEGFGKVTHDITRKRRMDEELRHGQKMEALGRLAGGIAHDFNNLLAAILGYGELLADRLGGDERSAADLQQLLLAAERGRDLVSQLLAFSRKQEVDRRQLDVAEVVVGLQPMLRRLVGDDIELDCELAHGAGEILADRGQIEQLVVNLVANAQDAMPNGGRLGIQVSAEPVPDGGLDADSYVVLRVTDTGTGMDGATAARAFDPFFTTKLPGHGTGLGLSTVHGIALQSEGDVHIDSRPGGGTTVTVRLRRVDGPPQQPVPKRPPRQARPQDGRERTATVLLVEDEEPVRSMLDLVLRQGGYSVLSAADGEAALDLLAGHPVPVDLVITDVSMPRLSGPDLVARLRGQGFGAKVIYISGFTARTVELGEGERYLQKPFSLAELLETTEELLGEGAA